MFWLYNLLVFLSLPAFPFIKFSLRKRGKVSLFGRLSAEFPEARGKVLVHAASVGEVVSLKPVLDRLGRRAALTVFTDYGLERAGSLYPNIPSRLLPIDFYPVVKSFLKKNRPEKILIYESEVWPSLLKACSKLGIPVFFISGKVSEKAFRRLLRFRAFLKPLFENVVFLARSVPDAERAEKLGFRSVKVVGDLKLDINRPKEPAPLVLEKPRPVILWGSTHPGEEDIAVKVHAELKEEFPDLLTVIAPRHVGRVKELRLPGRTLLRSSSVTVPSTVEFYVVDTLGELPALYAHADVAVIGGSFVPGIGGHNPVEALVWKKPVVVGPYSDHFSHIVEMLKIPVRRAEELPNFLKEALKGEITSDLSYNLWTASRGVAERILEIIGEKVVVEQA